MAPYRPFNLDCCSAKENGTLSLLITEPDKSLNIHTGIARIPEKWVMMAFTAI
jgi:hypothetical protein